MIKCIQASSLRRWALVTAGALALTAGLAAPALAADAAATTATVDEVVVTARKASESLQDVPLTVTAVSGASLDRFAMDKPEQVVSRIPTLNVSCCGSGSGAQVSLRGVGSSYISASFDSAVALDFDGVVVSSMRVLQSGFFDVRQVEVLKGPQSLYFGKSASAGVLSFKSAEPTHDWEFGGKASYEFEQKGKSVEAFASGPVTEQLGFRIAAKYSDVDEILHNSAPGVAHPDRGETDTNVRLTFQYDPTAALSANLKVNYIGHTSDGSIRNSVVDCGKNGVADPIALFGGAFLIPAGYNCDVSGHTYFLPDAAGPMRAQAPLGHDFHHGVPFSESDIYFGRAKVDWKLSDSLTLSSVTGYLKQTAADYDLFSYGGVLGGASFGTGGGLSYNNLDQTTQELRLASNFSGPLNFMFGGFYERRHIEFNTAQNGVNITLAVGPDPITGNTFDWFKEHSTNTKAYSLFGSLNYDITDKLTLSGGARWTKEEKVNTIAIPYDSIVLSAGPAQFAPSGFVAQPIHFDDSNVSPEASLSYKATDNVNLYVTYKEGFKSGGIDNSALPSNALKGLSSPDPAVRAATAAALIYQSETAKGAEVGVKSQWFDRSLTLNASIYDYVFQNLQVQIFDAVNVQFLTTNAGELTTKGADLDFRWVTPVSGLSLFGSLAYTDAKFTKTFVPDPISAPTVDLNGRRSAGAPEWSGNVAADLRTPVGNGLEFGLTGNLQYSGSYFTRQGSPSDYVQKAFATIDLATSIGAEDGKWQLSLIGTNLADKRITTSSGPRPFQTATGDDIIHNMNEGRKVTLQMSTKF